MAPCQECYDSAEQPKGVHVVCGEVVGDTGKARMDIRAAEVLGAHDFSGRSLHERRPAEEDRALLADDDSLIAHGRHISPAGRAGSHHGRNLRDAGGGHARLVEEDATEMLAIREDFVLVRKVCPARVH